MVSFTASRMWPSSHLRASSATSSGHSSTISSCVVTITWTPSKGSSTILARGDVAPPVKESSGKPRLGLVAGPISEGLLPGGNPGPGLLEGPLLLLGLEVCDDLRGVLVH